MRKRDLKRQGRSTPPLPHIAASAAESDLVKLTREFESLKKQLEENHEHADAHHTAIKQAHNLYVHDLSEHSIKINHLRRQRRVLESHFTNVSELMRPFVSGEPQSDCAAQTIGRCC